MQISEISGDRRTSTRHATRIHATLRERGRASTAVVVLNLSPFGCKVAVRSGAAEGMQLWLRLPGLESKLAKAIWSREDEIGLSFVEALHPAVVERLVR